MIEADIKKLTVNKLDKNIFIELNSLNIVLQTGANTFEPFGKFLFVFDYNEQRKEYKLNVFIQPLLSTKENHKRVGNANIYFYEMTYFEHTTEKDLIDKVIKLMTKETKEA